MQNFLRFFFECSDLDVRIWIFGIRCSDLDVRIGFDGRIGSEVRIWMFGSEHQTMFGSEWLTALGIVGDFLSFPIMPGWFNLTCFFYEF